MRTVTREEPSSALRAPSPIAPQREKGKLADVYPLLPSEGWEKVANGRMRALSACEVRPC